MSLEQDASVERAARARRENPLNARMQVMRKILAAADDLAMRPCAEMPNASASLVGVALAISRDFGAVGVAFPETIEYVKTVLQDVSDEAEVAGRIVIADYLESIASQL